MKLLAIFITFMLFVPFVSAFDIGGFEIKDGDLIGKYHPAGLEGCTISCYTNKHILDIVYKNKSIDITFEFLDDPILKKLVERDTTLKDEMEKVLMNKTLHMRGSEISFDYEGCKVELHDVPTRFLKISANKIILQNGKYELNRIRQNEIKLEKENFTSILISDNPLKIEGNNITAYGNIMLASFSLSPEHSKIENAFVERRIGGEVFIIGKKENDTISYFGNVSISPKISGNKIILKVKGDEGKGGKVIKVNLAKNICLSDKIIVRYDGKIINEANNITDILNPNDDGSNPEYYRLQHTQAGGVFLLISIPHFSEHEIKIEFIVKNPVFQILAVISGLIVVTFAAFYIFKP